MSPSPSPSSGHPSPEAMLRGGVLAVFLLSAVGLAAELLLMGHYEYPWQRVPLGLLAAGLAMLALHRVRPGPVVLRLFRLLMLLYLASSGLGMWLHHAASVEFELESHPDARGWPLFWSAVLGVSPPALAPGAMAALGLLGLLWTHQHPILRRPNGGSTP